MTIIFQIYSHQFLEEASICTYMVKRIFWILAKAEVVRVYKLVAVGQVVFLN